MNHELFIRKRDIEHKIISNIERITLNVIDNKYKERFYNIPLIGGACKS